MMMTTTATTSMRKSRRLANQAPELDVPRFGRRAYTYLKCHVTAKQQQRK